MSDLVRFSVSMPEDLLQQLDVFAERRGTNTNRSEVLRDLVREKLVDEERAPSSHFLPERRSFPIVSFGDGGGKDVLHDKMSSLACGRKAGDRQLFAEAKVKWASSAFKCYQMPVGVEAYELLVVDYLAVTVPLIEVDPVAGKGKACKEHAKSKAQSQY